MLRIGTCLQVDKKLGNQCGRSTRGRGLGGSEGEVEGRGVNSRGVGAGFTKMERRPGEGGKKKEKEKNPRSDSEIAGIRHLSLAQSGRSDITEGREWRR